MAQRAEIPSPRPDLRIVGRTARGVPAQVVQLAMILGALCVLPFVKGVDNDFWWHLRTGELIFQHGIPRHDPYSWTAAGQPWVAHEWLGEAIIYAIERVLGYAGNVVFFDALIAGAMLLMYRLGRREGAGTRPLVALTLVSACVMGLFITPRPQMFTFALYAVFVYVLATTDAAAPRRAWVLPPLMAVWVNLHLGFMFGLMVVALWTVASLYECVRGAPVDARQVLAIAAACVAAACLNPHGPAILWFPARYVFDSEVTQSYVAEWHRPGLLNPFHTAIFASAALLAWSVISRTRPRPFLVLLALAASVLAMQAVRNAPFAALLVVPVAGGMLARRWPSMRAERDSSVRMPRHAAVALFAITAALVGSIAVSTGGGVSLWSPSEHGYPSQAVAYVAEHEAGKRLLNDYTFGGYELSKLYPQTKVFIDGRSEFYGDAFLGDWLGLVRANPGWQQTLARYDPDVVLLTPDRPLIAELRKDPAWHEAYADAHAVVMVKDAD
jgi:hypothetical protein